MRRPVLRSDAADKGVEAYVAVRETARIAVTDTPVRSSTPRSVSQLEICCAAYGPSRSAWGTLSGVTMVVVIPRRASEAAASQPMNPEPMTRAVRA